MGRNTADFQEERHPALDAGSQCGQSGCGQPATKFSWDSGNFCSDCYQTHRHNTGRGKKDKK